MPPVLLGITQESAIHKAFQKIDKNRQQHPPKLEDKPAMPFIHAVFQPTIRSKLQKHFDLPLFYQTSKSRLTIAKVVEGSPLASYY